MFFPSGDHSGKYALRSKPRNVGSTVLSTAPLLVSRRMSDPRCETITRLPLGLSAERAASRVAPGLIVWTVGSSVGEATRYPSPSCAVYEITRPLRLTLWHPEHSEYGLVGELPVMYGIALRCPKVRR